jgi:hypothetical protein
MTLYHSPDSPNSRRVRIFLAEKGLSIPFAAIDLAKGEQHSEAYRKINPWRVVPTLVLEDGTAIGEVLASGATSKKSTWSARCSAEAHGQGDRRHVGIGERNSTGSLR